MNVAQLRKAIANLPDNMPVVTDHEIGIEDDVRAYLIPVNRRHGQISEGHLNPISEWSRQVFGDYENITALHISGWGCGGDVVDITPEQPPAVIDAEVIQPELPGGAA